jgi:outer membrane biosynthesis protein TonB
MKPRRPRPPRLLSFAGPPLPPGAVSAAVFALPGDPGRVRPWLLAGAAAVALGALGAVAVSRSAGPARPTEAPPRRELVVELFEVPAPAPEPAPPTEAPPSEGPPPARSAPRAPRPAAPTPAPSAPAAAPAQAAEVVAQEAPADEALDLTGFTIATGSGTHYAGGKTATAGTSTRAVTGAVSANGVVDGTGAGPGAPDLSQPVRLPDDEWDCPWPAEADALGIDEQTVTLRITARADGAVEAAEALTDPGHGFKDEALACARRHRALPARDRAGNPVRARSGPIRILFTR